MTALRGENVPPSECAAAAARLLDAAAASDWAGADPYDGLWWDWPRWMTGGRRRRQAIIQLHARAPVDIRVLRRRPYPRNPKALAIFAEVALMLDDLGHEPRDRSLAGRAFDALLQSRSPGTPAWGYPFDVQTRWSFYPAGSPNIIVTTFAVRALHRAARERARTEAEVHAADGASWVVERLVDRAGGFFVYHEGSTTLIHNANALGAHLAWSVLADRDTALRAIEPTVLAQRPDGSWPYGDGPGLEFVDSFHTGFVLEALAGLVSLDPAIESAIARGVAYYRERFFDERGAARLWPDRPFPEDAHSAGTALSTLAALHRADAVDRSALEPIARRVLSVGLAGDHAVHRRHRRYTTRVKYIRWADAHVALGLVNAAQVLVRPSATVGSPR